MFEQFGGVDGGAVVGRHSHSLVTSGVARLTGYEDAEPVDHRWRPAIPAAVSA